MGGRSLGTSPCLQGQSHAFSSAELELYRPLLVCPLEGPQGVRGKERFLRVTSGHLFEVELQAAQTLERLELQSLEAAEVEFETQAQREPLPEVSVGALGVFQQPALTLWISGAQHWALRPHGLSLVPKR